jgi:hypothetical protein
MAEANDSTVRTHQPLRMASMHQHLWSEPRPQLEENEDHDGNAVDGGSETVRLPSPLRGVRGQDAQGDASADVPADTDADRYEVKGRPMTCDRVANAIFLRAIIANRALAYPLEMYYREALEFYEDIAGLNEPGNFHQ